MSRTEDIFVFRFDAIVQCVAQATRAADPLAQPRIPVVSRAAAVASGIVQGVSGFAQLAP
jgi:hypothetical protein